MEALKQVSHAWDALRDGWQRLWGRAGRAVTRFLPHSDAEEEREQLALRNVGWGLLAVEVFDDDERVVVRLEAPGLQKKDFDLEVRGRYLVVRGHKQLQRERTEGRYHLTECAYGSFARTLILPCEVQAEEAQATYRNGILRIELPKHPVSRRRRIEVGVN